VTFIQAPSFVSYNDAAKIAADITRKSWQRKRDQDVCGSYTRQLIPEVRLKSFFPEKRDIGILYCHLLLHDTMLRDDSHRTGTADSPVCECGSKKNLLNIFYYVVSSGVLGGICRYTAYTNLRGFLTAYTHLSDHK